LGSDGRVQGGDVLGAVGASIDHSIPVLTG
jgi:hypothetical protein